jgi:DnaJ-class molecular chaperone
MSHYDVDVDDFGHELKCTICGGEGTCDDNADPLWDCDEIPHPCHACGGTGNRRDQRYM